MKKRPREVAGPSQADPHPETQPDGGLPPLKKICRGTDEGLKEPGLPQDAEKLRTIATQTEDFGNSDILKRIDSE